jgi:protein gp37
VLVTRLCSQSEEEDGGEMGETTGIEWADATWNPSIGCSKVSPGCDHCYAETLVNRFAGSNKGFPNRFDVMHIRDEKHLTLPMRWREPKKIFVNSLSDLFHDDVLKFVDEDPIPFLARVFAVMVATERHTFQVLTKRPGVMASVLRNTHFKVDVNAQLLKMGHAVMPGGMSEPDTPWPSNIWLGTSVENDEWGKIRLPQLARTPAAVRFVSAEPLLGPVDVTPWASAIDWVIVGGESGPGSRPMHPFWVTSLKDQCESAGIAFLHKQWGDWEPDPDGPSDGLKVERATVDSLVPGVRECSVRRVGKKTAGRLLHGRTWDGYPEVVTA